MSTSIKWTKEKIKHGLEEFFKANGRYPSASEIDKYNLLPSSRQIQRKFGGLVNLRSSLGLPDDLLDLTKGHVRSSMARKALSRGTDFEKIIYLLLVSKFGEIFVHAQKPFNNYTGRVDFFVYAKNYKFGIDVFFAEEFRSFMGCVNIKEKIYEGVNFDVIFLSVNDAIAQKDIDKFITNKINKLKKNIRIFNLQSFKDFIKGIEPLDYPPSP
jgi:hypothetical protein